MMMKRIWLAVAVVVGILPGLAGAQGQSAGRGQGQGGQGQGQADTKVSVAVVFRAGDQAIFRDYFRTHKITAQPLPPGTAMNVARGKSLPPGIAKRALPSGLLALGPKVDRDVSFSIVGDVVVATRSGVVIDILAGIFK